MRDGTSNLLDSDDPHVNRLYKDENLKVYNFFKDEFFGIERTIVQIARYLHRLLRLRTLITTAATSCI